VRFSFSRRFGPRPVSRDTHESKAGKITALLVFDEADEVKRCGLIRETTTDKGGT